MPKPTRQRTYYQKVSGRARANFRAFRRDKGVLVNAVSSASGAIITWLVQGTISGSFISLAALISVVCGGVGGWLAVSLWVFVTSLLQAPYELDEQRKEDTAVRVIEAEIETRGLVHQYATEIGGLRSSLALAEKENRDLRHRLEKVSKRSELSVRFTASECNIGDVGVNGYITVRNSGTETVKCWGHLIVDRGLKDENKPSEGVFVYWQPKEETATYIERRERSETSTSVELGSGDERAILVGQSRLALFYRWLIPYRTNEGRLSWATADDLYAIKRQEGSKANKADIQIFIEILSDPPSDGGPIRFIVTIDHLLMLGAQVN